MARRFLLLSWTAACGLILLIAAPSPAAPAHDDFADGAEVSLPFAMEVDTAGATDQPFEQSLSSGTDCAKHPGVWARFSPAVSTSVVAVIDGPQRSAVALFEGEDEGSLRFIYCLRSLDGRPGSSDGNLHLLEAGHTYHLRLSTAEDGPPEGSYDFLLDVAAGIAGRVRNQDGVGLHDTLAWAYDDGHRRIAAACSHYGSDAGRYRISGLPPGTYRIEFEAGACDSRPGDEGPKNRPEIPAGTREWYKDATSFAAATPVQVRAEGDASGINVALGEEGKPADEPEASPGPPSGSASDVPTVEATAPTPSVTSGAGPFAVGAGRERQDGGSGAALVVSLLAAAAGVAGVAWRFRRRARA